MSEENNDTNLPRWLISTAVVGFLGLVAFGGVTIGIIYMGMNTGIEQNRDEIKQLTTFTQKGFHNIVITMKDNNAALLKNINNFQKQTIVTTVKNEKDIQYLRGTAQE